MPTKNIYGKKNYMYGKQSTCNVFFLFRSQVYIYTFKQIPMQDLQAQVLNMHGDSTLSNLLESTSPAPVLRQHLKLAKTEENVLLHLLPGDAFLRPGTHPTFNDHANDDKVAFSPIRREGPQKLEIGNLKFSIASWDSKRAITLENVLSQPMHTHAGKLMVCVNTALPVLSHVHGAFILNTVVEEFNSSKLVRLEVMCNKQEATKLCVALKNPYLYGLEPKSVIILQNPVFKKDYNGKALSICCEKFADIVFLGQVVHPLLESHLRSQNEDKIENDSTNMSSEESESDEEVKSGTSSEVLFTTFSSSDEQYAYEEWREWGNKHSLRRMHSQALAAYTIAQRFHPTNLEVLAAKTASLINLGLFSAALKELDIISSQDPFNTGFITRKSHCLWGLGRYEEANEYLKECLDRLTTPDQGDSDEILKRGMFIQQIISRTEKIIQLKNDPTLLDNENFFKTQMRASYDDPEYYTPISLLLDDHNNMNDHRKIAVANQDVPAGKILAITKAFTVVVHDHNEMESGLDELINLTIQKLQIERPFEADFYKSLEWSSEKMVKLPKNDVADFCKRYTYESNDIAGVGPLQSQKQTRGIWTYPLNIRHACVGGNAVWYICGNLMFIRAICDIREGEKIIMAHVEPTKSFEVRTEFLNTKGLQCLCTLCQFEKTEPEHTIVRRNLLLNETHFKGYTRNIMESLPPSEINKLKHRIEDLEMLRSSYAKLNFPIVEPLFNFGLYLMEIQNFDEAISAFEKVYYVIDNTAALFTLVKLSLLLSYCYIAKKKGSNRARSKKWFQAMQSYTNLSYGSLQPLKNIFKTEFDYLKRKGIAS